MEKSERKCTHADVKCRLLLTISDSRALWERLLFFFDVVVVFAVVIIVVVAVVAVVVVVANLFLLGAITACSVKNHLSIATFEIFMDQSLPYWR